MLRSKMRGSAFLLCAATLVGVAVGYCLKPSEVASHDVSEDKNVQSKRPLADVGEGASVKALRLRIAELERQLAEERASRLTNASTNPVAVVPQGGLGQMRGDPRAWMENLKKNDPVRYAHMTNRFAQFRRHRLERQQRNLDFLASIDTSQMSDSAKETHTSLQDAIAHRAELEERLHQEGLTEDERRAVIEQLRASDHQLRELRRTERVNLFESTATALGFEGDDVREIVATLEEVVDATDSPNRHMGGPPPGGMGNR